MNTLTDTRFLMGLALGAVIAYLYGRRAAR
jgi:hypothetical protein